VQCDKTADSDRGGDYDHTAGAGSVVAVPRCSRLPVDFTDACCSSAPLVNHLVGKRIILRIAWILLYLVVAVSIGLLLFFTIETAIAEIQVFARTVSIQDEWRLPLWWQGSAFQQAISGRLPPPSQLFEAVTGEQGQLVLPAILDLTQGFGGFISGAFVIVFLSIYWSLNQNHFELLWLSLLPSSFRRQARSVWRTVEMEMGAYIRAEIIQSLMIGLLLGVGYVLIGSPYPALLALTGAVAYLIPLVGIPLVVIPVLLMGMLTSLPLSLFTALYALVVLITMIAWVKPRLFRRKWDNPILTIVLLIAMADAFGFIGIIAAPPLSVICQILWKRFVSHRSVLGAAAQISDLKERQEHVLEIIRSMEDTPPALVTSSIERLTQLIEKAEPILQSAVTTELSDLESQIPRMGRQE
jgi:putative permease